MNDIVRKSVTAEITSVDKDTGTFSAVLSTPEKDREGETLHSNEWKDFPARIPINTDHDMTVDGTVGSATPVLQADGTVHIEGTFASTPKGQNMRTLVKEGHVTTMSVEFMRSRTPSTEKGGSPTVTRELIGGAFTPYPMNPNAKVLASKSGARNSKSDAANIQAVHDAATALGADCGAQAEKSLGHKALGSALSGSVEDLKNRLLDAIAEFYGNGNDCYVWIQATFLDTMAAGTVVYEYNGDTFSQTFTDDGTGAELDGAPKDVSLITSVVLESEGKSLTTKAISDKPWSDFSQADYSIEQWRKACVVHPDSPSENKGDYKLPIREPNGDLNSNAVHAAAGRVHELQGASKAQAAKALISAYGQLKEDPPPALSQLAGDSSSDSAAKSAANAVDSVAEEQAKLDLQTSSYKFKSALAHALLAKSL